MELLYNGSLAGVSFSPAKEHLKKIGKDLKSQHLFLVHIHDNEYDKNAISVITEKGEHVGWVPKAVNTSLLEVGLENLKCVFMSYNINQNYDVVGLTVSIYRDIL